MFGAQHEGAWDENALDNVTPIAQQFSPVKEGGTRFVFTNISDGMYALRFFEDQNNNETLDSNLLGMPQEPFGFSNDARGFAGPPSFQDASFLVSGNTAITATLEP